MNEIWRPSAEMRKEKLWYSIVTRDRNGKVVSRERRKSHSLLKQWNQIVFSQMLQRAPGTNAVKDTDGVGRTVSPYVLNFRIVAPMGVTTYGIRVGTGNTPVAIDDYALETPIAHGIGAGQMEHLVCNVNYPVVAAPSCSFLVSRSIVNNSGGVITVREAAIYMWVASMDYYVCATRDVFGAPQAVPDGGGITIDWTIGVTV